MSIPFSIPKQHVFWLGKSEFSHQALVNHFCFNFCHKFLPRRKRLLIDLGPKNRWLCHIFFTESKSWTSQQDASRWIWLGSHTFLISSCPFLIFMYNLVNLIKPVSNLNRNSNRQWIIYCLFSVRYNFTLELKSPTCNSFVDNLTLWIQFSFV